LLLEPAAPVPVSAKVRIVDGHNDDVTHADVNRRLAPWADVDLACLIRLDRGDGFLTETSMILP